jgi:uncharacterized protein (TIGR02246 family)
MTTQTANAQVIHTIGAAMAAWDANDAEAFAALYAPDATVVLSGGTFLQGRDAIRAYMAAGFAGPLAGTRGSDEQESVRVRDGFATVTSRSGFSLPGASEPALVRRATWTLADHDGWWLIEAYHNSDI